MAKALYVLDRIPKNCFECEFLDIYDKDGIRPEEYFCGVPGNGENVEDYESCRPDWCPLKEIPERIPIEEAELDALGICYIQGWNACLQKIGGTDER